MQAGVGCKLWRERIIHRKNSGTSWVRIPAGPRIFSVDYSLSPKLAFYVVSYDDTVSEVERV